MPRKQKPMIGEWNKLVDLIEEYAACREADCMKGGGDPDAMPVIEAELKLAHAKLEAQLKHMQQQDEDFGLKR